MTQRPTCRTNFEKIICMENDIVWIKKGIIGVFGTIIVNIIITVLTK